MARAPDFDENELGGSMLDYWPAMYGEREMPLDPGPSPPPPRPGAPPVFVRRPPLPTEEEKRYSRKLRQAYNAWIAAGHEAGTGQGAGRAGALTAPSREMAEVAGRGMSEPPEIPKPRFQAGPPRRPANTRKPLPRHIVKQILAANSEAMLAVPPWLEEMEARRRATKPERDKARSLRREAGVERRAKKDAE